MATPIVKSKKKLLSVNLNWRAYFVQFCTEHGNDPIIYGKRLLFRDGWQYSAYDFAGPEYAPPEDSKELVNLQKTYWKEKHRLIKSERKRLEMMKDSLWNFQNTKSAALQQAISFVDEDTKKRKVMIQGLDFSIIGGRIEWLNDEEFECEKELRNLDKKIEEVQNVESR